MGFVTNSVTRAPLGLGRAALLVGASLLLHAWVISTVRDGLGVAALDQARTRTIEAALIAEAPPAPPPPPKRVAPRRPARPKAPPTPPPAPVPEPVPEVVPIVEAAPPVRAEEPLPEAPGESEAQVLATEATAPPTPAPDPALVEPVPAEADAGASGPDLAAEMRELGGVVETLPPAGTYIYTMRDSRYAALTGTTTIDWRVDVSSRRYETRLRSTVFGIPLADISSTGTIQRFGLAPERYVQKSGTRAPQATNVDWTQRIVTFSSRSYQRAAQDGMQDRLSFQFQLMAVGQRLPDLLREGATISMQVAGPRDVETYHFLVVGKEPVETGGGPVDTIKLDRPKSGPAEARIEVWLAPSLRYLPVRLRFTDRRDNVTESLLETSSEGPVEGR